MPLPFLKRRNENDGIVGNSNFLLIQDQIAAGLFKDQDFEKIGFVNVGIGVSCFYFIAQPDPDQDLNSAFRFIEFDCFHLKPYYANLRRIANTTQNFRYCVIPSEAEETYEA